MYGKWTDFVVSYCLLHCGSQTLTNTLVKYGISTLLVRNVFIVQPKNIFYAMFKTESKKLVRLSQKDIFR